MESIYFIGIGGIGMSALARYYNGQGVRISGYDKTETTLTKKLVSEGMEIHYHEDIDIIPKSPDMVIITPAIPANHKELEFYRNHGTRILKRAEVLGMISREKRCIAIAGTHGKTSTSAITAHLLTYGKKDVSAFVGGIMNNYDSNYLGGNSDLVVLEADEFDRSFLHLEPEISVILSMDPDHLDIYGTEETIQESYRSFCRRTKSGGVLVFRESLRQQLGTSLLNELAAMKVRCISFGEEPGSAWYLEDLLVEEGKWKFKAHTDNGVFNFSWRMPGKHNAMNALAAIGVAGMFTDDADLIREAIASFKGIRRRFDIVFQDDKHVYIDDYAHHPTELNAALEAARAMFPDKKLTAIFQPHLYSRTRDFCQGFAHVLDKWDEVILLDIYPARELPIEGVESKMILKAMKMKSKKLVKDEMLMDKLKNEIKDKEVIMTLGAGDIDLFIPKIKALLTNG